MIRIIKKFWEWFTWILACAYIICMIVWRAPIEIFQNPEWRTSNIYGKRIKYNGGNVFYIIMDFIDRLIWVLKYRKKYEKNTGIKHKW